MKTIIRCDFVFQTTIIALIFLLLITGEFGMAWGLGESLLLWQAISAIIILVMNHGQGPRRILFLSGLLGRPLCIVAAGSTEVAWLKSALTVIIIALPVVLLICYWLLTACNLNPTTMRSHKGKFLPHTSF
jgi:hypothetical protein